MLISGKIISGKILNGYMIAKLTLHAGEVPL